MATLKILVFKGEPDTANRRHTALLIERSDGSNLLIHAVGNAPYFERTMDENTQATRSKRLLKEIFVATITGATVAAIGGVLYRTPVQNTPGWNCHNWVQDALEATRTKDWITARTRSSAIATMMQAVNG